MSKKREHRQAKKKERKRKKRDQARASRGSRRVLTENTSGADMEDAALWPVGECYVSSNWFERGVVVQAGFTRVHSDGRKAAAFFEVDLADKGVIACVAKAGLTEAHIQGELVRRSSEETPMLLIEPELVVKLVETGADWGSGRGNKLPPAFDKGQRLFGDVRSADCAHEILCGTEDEPAPAAPPSDGMFAALKRRLGM